MARGPQHADLDAGGREVRGKVCQGPGEEVWRDRLNLSNAEGGLHGEGRDGGRAEEAVGSEGLQVGGDAGAAGRIVAGDGEEDLREAPIRGRQGACGG